MEHSGASRMWIYKRVHTYPRLQNNWGPENGFQRILVPVYSCKTVENKETDCQLFWKGEYETAANVSWRATQTSWIVTQKRKQTWAVEFIYVFTHSVECDAATASQHILVLLIHSSRVSICIAVVCKFWMKNENAKELRKHNSNSFLPLLYDSNSFPIFWFWVPSSRAQ